MLVLSRKIGETIQIDEDIFVTVQSVRGGRVRIAVDAPQSVRVVRTEVLEKSFDCEAKQEIPQFSPIADTTECVV